MGHERQDFDLGFLPHSGTNSRNLRNSRLRWTVHLIFVFKGGRADGKGGRLSVKGYWLMGLSRVAGIICVNLRNLRINLLLTLFHRRQPE